MGPVRRKGVVVRLASAASGECSEHRVPYNGQNRSPTTGISRAPVLAPNKMAGST